VVPHKAAGCEGCGTQIRYLTLSTEFLGGIVNTPPFHAPYQTTTYNNIAFVLLSYVAEAVTGKPFLQMMEEAVIAPLNLTRTFTHPTKEAYGVIPGTLEDTMWATDLGNEAP